MEDQCTERVQYSFMWHRNAPEPKVEVNLDQRRHNSAVRRINIVILSLRGEYIPYDIPLPKAGKRNIAGDRGGVSHLYATILQDRRAQPLEQVLCWVVITVIQLSPLASPPLPIPKTRQLIKVLSGNLYG